MRIAITGATGFLGRYLVRHLAGAGHELRCWYRPGSDRSGFDSEPGGVDWLPGQLGDADATRPEGPHVGLREMDAVRAPHVALHPAHTLEVLDRRAAVELAAVRVLLDRLREVGV